MTLIAAWKRDGRVLMASDTAATAPGVTMPTEKVWRVGSRMLMWGYSGPEPYGERLRALMDGELPDSWHGMLQRVAEMTRRVNAQVRSDSRAAGLGEPPGSNLITVLVAGVVEGVAHVIEAQPSGMADFSPLAENFIGAGLFTAGAAEYAYLASSVAMQFVADDEQVRIPRESERSFRSNPNSDSGVFEHLAAGGHGVAAA